MGKRYVKKTDWLGREVYEEEEDCFIATAAYGTDTA